MTITVNGQATHFDEDALTVTDLLSRMKVKQPEMVSVELNGSFLERDTFANTEVKNDDRVEFLYFMGGGQSAQ